MNNPKILVVGAAWVGDMVMAQTLFKLLKQRQPDAIIDVMAPAWTSPLLERMPEVRRAIGLAVGHGELGLKKRYQAALELRKENYDQAILLPNSLKSAIVPWLAKIPKRTGWLREMRFGLVNDIRRLDKEALPLMIERFMALGLSRDEKPIVDKALYPSLVVNEENIQTALQSHDLGQPQSPVLALCPGAEFGPAKRWPENYYAEVANEKLSQGWDVWIFGSKKDQPVAEDIQRLTERRCRDLTGRTSLAEAIDLLSLASYVVTNDSGLMHVSAALNRPIVALYGSSDPRFTPPLSDNVSTLSLNLDCSPCFKRVCPLEHMNCLKELKPASVLEILG